MKTRPPNAPYLIRELIAAGKYDEAQAKCDENVEHFRRCIQYMQDMFIDAQRGRLGMVRDRDLSTH